MDINLKEINSYTQELTVGLEWAELSDDFNKFIGKFGKQIKMPGFRPGKVPKPVLMKQFLPLMESQFVEDNVQKYSLAALIIPDRSSSSVIFFGVKLTFPSVYLVQSYEVIRPSFCS